MIWNPWKEIKRLKAEIETIKASYRLLKAQNEILAEMLKHAQKNDNRGKDGKFTKAKK